jgi:uncharacterized protein (DUF2267 family)
MSTTGLEIFDSSLQRTHIWLDEIITELGPDRSFAWHVLGAVLHAIRDRIPVELIAHFGAQLPLIARGLLYDQWSPGSQDKPARTYEAFLQQIQGAMKNARPVGPADAATAVFRVLSRHLTDGEIAKVQASLPEPIREIWFAAEQQNAVKE